ISDVQTGVTDGNEETQSVTSSPRSISRLNVGASPVSTAFRSMSARSESTTMSTSFRCPFAPAIGVQQVRRTPAGRFTPAGGGLRERGEGALGGAAVDVAVAPRVRLRGALPLPPRPPAR